MKEISDDLIFTIFELTQKRKWFFLANIGPRWMQIFERLYIFPKSFSDNDKNNHILRNIIEYEDEINVKTLCFLNRFGLSAQTITQIRERCIDDK